MSRIFLFSITGIIKYIDHKLYILYNYHSNVLIFYSISELSNYNSLAAVGLVAVCEILMMICEIASVNDMLRNDDATSIASYHRYCADWL